MTDEKYLFISDCREKKHTARSAGAMNKKHRAVRLPSDYLSKKELKAMSGKVESYRMNDPMTWEEFRAMPEDLQRDYICLIRERFGVSDTTIAKMLGINQASMSRTMIKLNLGKGKHCEFHVKDKEGFLKWANGVKEVREETPVAKPVEQKPIQAVLNYGNLSYSGAADDILKTVSALLGNRRVKMSVSWEVEEGNG
jgi:hypothetical protein